MSDDVIKNPARDIPKSHKKYEPEYQRMNKLPIIKEESIEMPRQIIDDTFMSVDNSFVDEDGNDQQIPDGHIIDNNDFVDFGIKNDEGPINIITKPKLQKVQNKENIKSTTKNYENNAPEIGDFILMVFGKIITSGNLGFVESKIKSIIYNEDPQFSETEVKEDDIVVLKRVGIKIGVFIDD